MLTTADRPRRSGDQSTQGLAQGRARRRRSCRWCCADSAAIDCAGGSAAAGQGKWQGRETRESCGGAERAMGACGRLRWDGPVHAARAARRARPITHSRRAAQRKCGVVDVRRNGGCNGRQEAHAREAAAGGRQADHQPYIYGARGRRQEHAQRPSAPPAQGPSAPLHALCTHAPHSYPPASACREATHVLPCDSQQTHVFLYVGHTLWPVSPTWRWSLRLPLGIVGSVSAEFLGFRTDGFGGSVSAALRGR